MQRVNIDVSRKGKLSQSLSQNG